MTREEQIRREMADVIGDSSSADLLFHQLGAVEVPTHTAAPEATAALARLRRRMEVPRWMAPVVTLMALGFATAGPLGRVGLTEALTHTLWVVLLAVVVPLAALSGRHPRAVLGAALLASWIPALGPAMPGPMAAMHCMSFEAMATAGPLAFAAIAAWRSRAVTPAHLGAVAACGALAGSAALAIMCSGHSSTADLVVSHAAGVWIAAAVGGAVGAVRTRFVTAA